MKRKVVSKLRLSRETLHSMTASDLQNAVGGITQIETCPTNGPTTCCPTQSFSQEQGSCPKTWRCCY